MGLGCWEIGRAGKRIVLEGERAEGERRVGLGYGLGAAEAWIGDGVLSFLMV